MNTATTFAAPASIDDDDDDELEPAVAQQLLQLEKGSDGHLDAMCEQLVHWCLTRRYYAKSSLPVSLLGKLGKRTRPARPGGPDADCNAELAALYLAFLSQPGDAIDRQVFVLHYFVGVRNVKVAAAELRIGRQHWYTLLREFRRRIYAASQGILDANERALAEMESRHADRG